MGRKYSMSFPNKGQREGIKRQPQQRGMQAQPLGHPLHVLSTPQSSKNTGGMQKPQSHQFQRGFGSPSPDHKAKLFQKRTTSRRGNPWKGGALAPAPCAGQPRVPAQSRLCVQSGARQSRWQTRNAASPSLLPAAAMSPRSRGEGEPQEAQPGNLSGRVYTRGFPMAEIPAGICQGRQQSFPCSSSGAA